MAEYTDGQKVTFDGEYTMRLYASTGTAKLTVQDGNRAAVDVPDASTTNANLIKNIKLSGNYIIETTDDGAVYLNKINV